MKHSIARCLANLLIAAGPLVLGAAQEALTFELCAICPDPYRDIGPDNLPPKSKTGAYMWVNTEAGIELLNNPDWSGGTQELACRRCPNPLAGFSWSNLPLFSDEDEYIWVRERTDDNTLILRARKNPDWKGGDSSDGEQEPDDEEDSTEDRGPLTQPIDRSQSAYHRAGQDVFQRQLLSNIGGVLSQGELRIGGAGRFPTVEVVLGPDGRYPGYIVVHGPSVSGHYPIQYEELVPAALFVASEGTSLYTLWETTGLAAGFAQDAGFVKAARGPGYLAAEFAGTRYEDALVFLDLCYACLAISLDELERQIADRTAAGEFDAGRPRSYINTDVGLPFRLLKQDAGRVAVNGAVSRFYWSIPSARDRAVVLDMVIPIAQPDEMLPNANRILDAALGNHRALEDKHIQLLMLGVDILRPVREQAAFLARRRLADALSLFETLALLRATMRNAPDQWSAFFAALSSGWLVSQQPEPWVLYSETLCHVYSDVAGCK